MTLPVEDFPDFYQAVHGHPPFPWQADLTEQVLAQHAWPQLIDVPTGLGKTGLLDVAVFVAAATSGDDGADRLGRRRIFFVVDRRIVVDEAHEHAGRLSGALDAALASDRDTAARRVAVGLHAFAPTAGASLSIPAPVPAARSTRTVLPVTRMRGGVTWDASWLDRPDLPGIVVGTVDQVGSRLLFRGYGVSARRASIDAALVGIDSLILIDEAHLAEVLVATVTEAHRRDHGGLDLPRADVVRMTATAGADRLRRYTIDVEAHRDTDVAWRRLTASKRLTAVDSDPKLIVQTMTDQVVGLLTAEHDTILVVCNTVDRARQVHAALIRATKGRQDPLDAEVALLIGRSRPADRDLLMGRLTQRFGVGRVRESGATPGILVATQTVEVGANLDADGLVSESAPWDCLVQRLGRLNRVGECPSTARAIVVHDGIADGPVYGRARDLTWAFLCAAADGGDGLDVSPVACRDLAGQLPAGVVAARPIAPLLTIPTLDSWARTGPVPVPDTPVAPFLHGLGTDFATASVAWRDGLVDPDPTGDDAERPDNDVNADLAALPIRAEELVEVPMHAVRRWLRGESAVSLSDLDEDADPQQRVRHVRDPFRALAWRADPVAEASDATERSSRPIGGWVWVEASAVRPGDVLVVPAERGGLDEFGWAPDSKERVLDVSEVIRSRPDAPRPGVVEGARGRPLLRIDDGTARRLGLLAEDARELRRLLRELVSPSAEQATAAQRQLPVHLAAFVDRVVQSVGDGALDERVPGTAWTPAGLSALKAWLMGSVTLVPIQDEDRQQPDRFILTPSTGMLGDVERDDELPECSSIGTGQVTLRAHHVNVGDRARDIAQALGLPAELAIAVEAAARWHDLGKVESRFQAMLCGGDEYEAMLVDEPLAKSGIDPADRSAYRIARQRSRLPQGARHEAWSAALVREYLAGVTEAPGFDFDLVIHLVASHHGHARPWLPAVRDDRPRQVTAVVEPPASDGASTKVRISSADTIDFDHPMRFARLNDRYGRWGLALLETIVRCADMTVSGEGS